MNPCATRRILYRTIWPWTFRFLVKISLNPIDFVARLVSKGPNTLWFLKEEYSTFNAIHHWDQSRQDLASSSITKSVLERVEKLLWRPMESIWSILEEGCTEWRLRFWGKTVMGDEPTHDSGLWVILVVLLKPSGNFQREIWDEKVY